VCKSTRCRRMLHVRIKGLRTNTQHTYSINKIGVDEKFKSPASFDITRDKAGILCRRICASAFGLKADLPGETHDGARDYRTGLSRDKQASSSP
jgi:hypothetical protein